MSFGILLLSILGTTTAQNPSPDYSITAHPVGLIIFPMLGHSDETNTHFQLDVVQDPTARTSRVAHFTWSRLMIDRTDPNDFNKTDINRVSLELGARYRFWPQRGYYGEATLGYQYESYSSKWLEAIARDPNTQIETSRLAGKIDNGFHQPYVMTYLGWATDPTRRWRWDLGVGVGVAILGGTGDLTGIEWTGNTALANHNYYVKNFLLAPLVLDLNIGLGVNF